MLIAREDVSREQVIWLLLHSLCLILIGVALVAGTSEYFQEVVSNPFSRVTVAIAGRVLVAVVGFVLTVVACIRLFQPFSAGHMKFKMLSLVFGEFLLIGIGGGMVLDGGVLGSMLAFASISVNLCILAFKRL